METKSFMKIRFSDCDPFGHLNNSRYLDYMLNAREDHVAEHYGFTNEEHAQKTGCTWVALQNEIAYLKEVRYNKVVEISSKIVHFDDRTAKIEVLMKDPETDKIYAVLWCTGIYFNLQTRKSETQPDELKELFKGFHIELDHKDFQSRVNHLRAKNK